MEQRNGVFSMVFVFLMFLMFNLVIPRRGIRDDKGCTHALCPDVGIYRCVSSLQVVMSRVVGISTEVEQW